MDLNPTLHRKHEGAAKRSSRKKDRSCSWSEARRSHIAMLFVITMEVLNSLIKEADRRAALMPLLETAIVHHLLLYADDLVVLLDPTQNNLLCLHQILYPFAGTSGLVTNIEKCVATPIWCIYDMVMTVQQAFLCIVTSFHVGTLAFRYR
jgi:hypothetical protein